MNRVPLTERVGGSAYSRMALHMTDVFEAFFIEAGCPLTDEQMAALNLARAEAAA